ncbi:MULTISPECIES: helix-turn-helix transcriptional regulator [Brucella/Ochrobactrum group]|uniref:helix-turn-helix domain-containing protein n=1 Tax=Brucella/Ochrobactrum group TaxID=2826938 RepID=UPI000DEFD080|nr:MULTISPECIES: helix-turn-helix transcriptional regulator [Brucella/Ochrobactrum group]
MIGKPQKTPARHDFAERLKAARKHLKITQEELAGKAGLSTITISKLETGSNNPSFDVISLLCKAMDIEPNYFFGWTPDVTSITNAEQRRKIQRLLLNVEKLDDIWIDELISLSNLVLKG